MYTAYLFAILILFVPGYAVARIFCADTNVPVAVIAAPVISAAYYGILGIVYKFIGIQASVLSMFAPAIVILVVEIFIYCRRRGPQQSKRQMYPFKYMVAYVVIGTFIGWYVFIRSLPTASSMIEEYDVIFHANLIRKFIDTGVFSCFGVNVGTLGSDFYGGGVSGFYPAAWHEVAALVSMSIGVGATTAMNATNWAFCSIVLPLGMLGVFMCVFKDDRRSILVGSVVPLAFVEFPWKDLLWGPIFPNTAAFCSAPAVVAIFMALLAPLLGGKNAKRLLPCGLLGIIGLGMLQPNSVFAAAVPIAFYFIYALNSSKLGRHSASRGKISRFAAQHHMAVSLCVLATCILIWTLLYKAPFMQGVVSFEWPSFLTLSQTLINVLLQVYTMGLGYHNFPQTYLGMLVLLGILIALLKRDTRWLVAPFGFFLVAFIVNVTSDGMLKQYLTGFWYSDPHRIAAICTLCSMPFAVLGLSSVVRLVRCALDRFSDFDKRSYEVVSLLFVAMTFLLINFYPNYVRPSDESAATTAFGEIRSDFSGSYSQTAPLTHAEEEFIDEVKEVIPQGSLVINNPGDGSVAAYGFDGLNVVYNQIESEIAAATGEDSADSQLIRTSLADIASSSEVNKAIEDTGAKYVLLLSTRDGGTSVTMNYVPEQWAGITGITDETPGFRLVLKKGDMRLYEIQN